MPSSRSRALLLAPIAMLIFAVATPSSAEPPPPGEAPPSPDSGEGPPPEVEVYRITGSPTADGCGGRIVLVARHITLNRRRSTVFADVVNRTYSARFARNQLRAWGRFDSPSACDGGVDERYDMRQVSPTVLRGTIRSTWRLRPGCEECSVTFQVRAVRVR